MFIIRIFVNDPEENFECLNGFDENSVSVSLSPIFYRNSNIEPRMKIEDIQCALHSTHFYSKMSSSCFASRNELMRKLITYEKPNSVKSTEIHCLCPQSYYGKRCEYQNERVSLTMKFQFPFSYRKKFYSILIYLIDDTYERIIHSFKQINHIDEIHCQMKYNIYFIYSTRPKLKNRNYSIHVDLYDKDSFYYYGSLFIPVRFSFLPVNRLAVHMNIPEAEKSTCLDKKCAHGQWYKYLNDMKSESYCQCQSGWSGKYCDISYQCNCGLNSICVGKTFDNRSICICRRNHIGSRCLLQSPFCQYGANSSCLNNGECISIDDKFICICRTGFRGDRCEILDKKIEISFDEDIQLSQSILIHFIQIDPFKFAQIGSTYRNIPSNTRSISILWSEPFHLLAVQLLNDTFYLIDVENRSSIVNRYDRCPYFNELFEKTIVEYHLVRRIKYYHIPCRNHSYRLKCFIDQNYFCLCEKFGNERVANCFKYNGTKTYDCYGSNSCENGGECLQDRSICPKTSVCRCQKCFYGVKCQFSSNMFSLSLDGILAYQIQPNLNLQDQLIIIKISIAFVGIIFLCGIVNGLLTLKVFSKKEQRETACGVYLFISSMNSLFVMIIFTLKFSTLLLSQIQSINHRLFLYIQCLSLDYLLNVSLNMDQWLSASVAFERTIAILKGIGYDKNRSKKVSKYIIIGLIILTISTFVHDPIHRQLLDEEMNDIEEKRIWCIVRYSNTFSKFNSIISIFHSVSTFIINIISALIIIIMSARKRRSLQSSQSYQHILSEQIHQHMNLLISPVILVVLSLPRLIISFSGACMKSTRNSWLFLIGYFISIIPSTITCLIFIVPSTSYRQALRKILTQHQRTVF